MSVAKSLWVSVQGDPVFMRRVNGWLTMFWLAMIPISYTLGLLNSVVYVSALSLWALVSGHWSAWQAARIEVAQEKERKRVEAEPIEQKVVETMVERTRRAVREPVTAAGYSNNPQGASTSSAARRPRSPATSTAPRKRSRRGRLRLCARENRRPLEARLRRVRQTRGSRDRNRVLERARTFFGQHGIVSKRMVTNRFQLLKKPLATRTARQSRPIQPRHHQALRVGCNSESRARRFRRGLRCGDVRCGGRHEQPATKDNCAEGKPGPAEREAPNDV